MNPNCNSIACLADALSFWGGENKHFRVRARGPERDNNTYCMMKVGYILSNKGARILKVRIHRKEGKFHLNCARSKFSF